MDMDSERGQHAEMHRLDDRLTRRAALGGLAVGGLAAALAARDGRAQEASPAAAPTALPPALREWVAGWEALDFARVAAAYAPDGVREDVPLGVTRRGPDEIRAHLTASFGAFAGLTSRFTSVFAAGDWGAAELELAGSYTGQLPGFPPGTGQSLVLRVAQVLELRGDRIGRAATYYDRYGVLQQLGLVPALDGSPVASPAAT
jgi:steroid delta-isomerase-like uncharacterized protein